MAKLTKKFMIRNKKHNTKHHFKGVQVNGSIGKCYDCKTQDAK